MIRQSCHGAVWYEFSSLAKYGEVQHAVLTRLGGTSTGPMRGMNVGHLVGDRPEAVAANHQRIFMALGVAATQVVTAWQVHGAHVALVGPADSGSILSATDGLVTTDAGVVLMLRFADCLPLMLYDPVRHAVALVHVGWRGIVAEVVHSAVSLLQSGCRSEPKDLVAGLGPAIGVCCYEVGSDMKRTVERALGTASDLFVEPAPGRLHFDLPRAVRWQLEQHGITQIEESRICTACHAEEFFSHRGDRGSTGRFAALLGLRRRRVG